MDIWGVLEYTSMAAIAGLLLWAVKWIFYDKLDARWHYYIWLVLLARLAVPVRFRLLRTPLSIFREIPVEKWIEKARILAERGGFGETAVLLGRMYLWGALLLGGFYLAAWVALRVQTALAPEADESVREYVEGIGAKYGLRSCRHIRICKSGTPYICGLADPVLMLPGDNLRPEEPVIVHELLHRKYMDVGVNLLLRAVRTLNWFNPVIWYLTALVQNDNEALCDQRVLEHCRDWNAKAYGELLIQMGEGKKRPHVRTGTSDLGGSYRNMRTRIRRIGDFGRIPKGTGFVALCITAMLSAAVVGSAEVYRFEAARPGTEEELERALLEAECYHAHTPEEAVYLFLLAARENHPAYRMAVMPEEERERFRAYTELMPARGGVEEQAAAGYPAYFPREGRLEGGHSVYNLWTDGERGSATVCLGDGRGDFVTEWRLSLVKEDGWKVRLEEERRTDIGDWQGEPMLWGSARIGDFQVDCMWYNEGSFQGLSAGSAAWGGEPGWIGNGDFPLKFSQEYRSRRGFIRWLGEEPLAGHQIRVVTAAENWDWEPEEKLKSIQEYAAMAGAELKDGAEHVGTGFFGSAAGEIRSFDGGCLTGGEPVLISGAGTGIYAPEERWKPGEEVCLYVRIYIDDVLAEEGEVWSGGH